MRPLKLLVVHAELPMADRDAVSLRLERTLKLLVDAGHQVTFFGRSGRQQPPQYRRRIAAMGIEVHCWDPERLRAMGYATTDPAIDVAAIFGAGFDLAWVVTWATAEEYLPLLRRHAPATQVVVDTTDVAWVRERRGAELSGLPADLAAAEATRRREGAAYRAADALVAISAEDEAELHRLAPGVPVRRLGLIEDAPAPGPGFADRDGVLFVGNFRHRPNVDGVRWLVEEVWPHVRAARPGLQARLVGSAPPEEVLDLASEDVTVTGWVPELEPELRRARVAIAPLRYGGGIKGKIAQALAHGVPVVTTPIGAEGMDLADGADVLVAADAAAFAAAVVRAHDDAVLWSSLVEAGRAWARERTSSEAAARDLEAALPRPVRVELPRDDTALRALLLDYVTAAEGTPASLQLVTAAPLEDAYARVAEALRAVGADPERVPDMTIVPRVAVDPGPAPSGPEAWRAAVAPVRAQRAGRAVLALLDGDRETAQAQAEALRSAPRDPDTRVVLVADGWSDAERATLRQAAPEALVVGWPSVIGRRGATHRAIVACGASEAVVFGPLALPGDGLEALLDAAAAGTVAAPRIAGIAGLTLAADGSLWPAVDGAPVDALAGDVLAAPASFFLDAPLLLPARDGHGEAVLARHAQAAGLRLDVVETAWARRVTTPPVSVVVATRNRAAELRPCVALLVALGLGDDGSEVVLVDNGSDDDTAAVIATLAAEHPDVVVEAHEPRVGLCHARNAGVAAARHDLLLFLDDDARPTPSWRTALAHALTRPGVVNAGGPIVALWPAGVERPAAGLERLFSVLDLGDARRDVAPPEFVFGANWAARRDALERVGGFDPQFGLAPGRRINADETSVAWRWHLEGVGTTRWVPEAAVGHRIDPRRVAWRWMVDRSYLVGVERARQDQVLHRRPRAELEAQAGSIAGLLLRHLPGAAGDLGPEELLAQVVDAREMEEEPRIALADHLGWFVGTLALLGEQQASAGPLRVHVSPEHADGQLAPPVGAAR